MASRRWCARCAQCQSATAGGHAQTGLTLLELLIVLVIAGVLLGQVVPAFARMAARNTLAATANELLSVLHTARHTAVSRNRAVTFCAGTPQQGCHGDWARGQWIVFLDREANGRLDAGETLLIAGALPSDSGIGLQGNGPFAAAVVFRPDGSARTANGAWAMGRLRVCVRSPSSVPATDLVLIASGRTVAQPLADSPPGCIPL
ncbi:type IV fimbrial biogenesis protein FimT [Fontimonas thermophila]|uniref:Type II secretion system protein H n=1 Tax=Fontimonas thermophila TaxID=1076937 RepID=A0A1I2KLV2_9GAMM|nr:GspH/FimT family protein [Fontimonas thermophila]SFF66081.1 type IV fimbrial biogenesis protein FimT [Fontimonas thermophila]